MAGTSTVKDDFVDNSISESAWTASTSGSATVAETGGEARFTLPASTAGTHIARYTARYTADLTGDSTYVNIDTMVATGVAATAFFQVYLDNNNALQWIQLSGTLYARSIVAGVSTDHFSATWNSSTYKYLRIRHSAGNIEWHSSLNGTTWTLRATLTTPFAITALYLDFGATCGNVASPGSFRVEDINLILPALTTNWNYTTAIWELTNRHETATIAIDTVGTVQGYIVTADGADVNDDPVGNIRYWSGPAGDGRLLTEQTSQAAAEAMAVNLPLDGRLDLAEMIDGRYFRLYHRSIDGASYFIREFFPRRLVESDDIRAESIRTINLAAGAVTADKIDVQRLSAITAQMGTLNMDGFISIALTGGIYQGTGTDVSPTTGLKIYNSGGIGKLSTYNATVEQIKIDTDGILKAGAGSVALDANGLTLVKGTGTVNTITWRDSVGGTIRAGIKASTDGSDGYLFLQAVGTTIARDASIELKSWDSVGGNPEINMRVGGSGGTTGAANIIIDGSTALAINNSYLTCSAQVRAGGYFTTTGAGALPPTAVMAMGYDTGSTRGLLVAVDNGTYRRLDLESSDLRLKYQTTNRIQITSAGLSFFNVAPVAQQTGGALTAAATYAANEQTMLNRLWTAARNLGLIT